MGCLRALICIIFPPLAVLDRGCGTVLLVLILTIIGWVPGVIAALLLNFMAEQNRY
ncbi:MAG: YqaE/Pmp3 family membrane protein [Anaerolineae bacterium]|nr:YqaE/Pmp3 family membrane protein [Anaerolineae bacterium]